MDYEKRIIDQPLAENLQELPAILIEGAKAVGKTETASRLAKTMMSLDNPQIKMLLRNNPEAILSAKKPVLIDEWQLEPNLWSYVRHQVDAGLSAGSVLFTGSSVRVNSRIHSGAGRIIRMKMRPYSVQERKMSDSFISVDKLLNDPSYQAGGISTKKLDNYLDEVFRSGFPGIRNRSSKARELLIRDYVNNIIQHDFEENGFTAREPETLRSWMRAYAAAIGTTTSYKKIIDTAMANNEKSPSRPTADFYRDALEILYVIDDVPSFIGMGKLFPALTKAPKHFMLDPAIAMSLLDVTKEQLTDFDVDKHVGKINSDLIGQLMESLVYQSLIVYADALDAHLYHFRDSKGRHEIDFILQKGRKLVLFEVKTNPNVKDSYVRHLNWFEELAGEEYQISKVLLNTGQVAYQRQEDKVQVVPIAMLGL
ncbi:MULTISPECIES: ATP-binding protein [Lactobacillus]|uniref:ATP-binding protein n=1 Tax=Lactobacillus xujianguonis TaxID=2495899 RepID=A0A437SVD4_9LACO|nr:MULTISPECIES: DUF4143 domain-containing protein [Lactobacillus]RVU70885.1 ATP-binding protein [Lactobacillus xujianguonis]RVU73768.1 ATP-binding protein [Lactobacillus xujianguonis]